MKRLFIVLLLSMLCTNGYAVPAREGIQTDAPPLVLYGKTSAGALVPLLTDTDGTVQTSGGGAPEGTAVLSTGEAGGTKYLREDGDGTSSWQTPAGSGDVTGAASSIDNAITRFNGTGGKTIQDYTKGAPTIDDSGKVTIKNQIVFDDVATPSAPTAATDGAGNLTGDYKYKVTYYVNNPIISTETDASAASNTLTTSSNAVELTIPVSADDRVKGRRVYRTQAGGSTYNFVANVTNNTATTYSDDATDASIVNNSEEHGVDTTAFVFWDGNTQAMAVDINQVMIGYGAGDEVTSGLQNVCIGPSSCTELKTGEFNMALGGRSLMDLTSGTHNVAIGRGALENITTGTRNIGIGFGAGDSLTTHRDNTVIGIDAGAVIVSDGNLLIGYHTGILATSGGDLTLVGDQAGASTLTTAAKSTCLGSGCLDDDGTTSSKVDGTNMTCIGYQCQVEQNNTVVLGGVNANAVAVGIGNTAPASVFVGAPPSAETITAGATITADGCGTIKQITAAGSVTTDTTNTFTAPSAANTGCIMTVINTGSQNITLDNNANFKSAGGADVTMTGDDSVVVASNGTDWYQVSALLAN